MLGLEHLISERNQTAQLEIQELSTHWGRIVGDLFPVSWDALTNEGE